MIGTFASKKGIRQRPLKTRSRVSPQRQPLPIGEHPPDPFDGPEAEMTQKDLARKMGRSETAISRWISGFPNLTLKSIAEISTALGEPLRRRRILFRRRLCFLALDLKMDLENVVFLEPFKVRRSHISHR